MKRISNSRIYKIFGYLLIGIGVFILIGGNNNIYADNSVTERTTQYKRNRHTITLELSQLEDLKVTEGQRINIGQIIADRTSTKTKLQTKKERLSSAIARAKLPLNQLKSVPKPSFDTELVNLKKARFELDSITKEIANFDHRLNFKDEWLSTVFESEKMKQLADLKRRELSASINLEKAIASLDEAKLNYQRQQYQHSLKVSDYQTLMQKQQTQIASLQTQLDKVDEELDNLTSVYSPYRGKVRRIKILGQNERWINAEVTLDIRNR